MDGWIGTGWIESTQSESVSPRSVNLRRILNKKNEAQNKAYPLDKWTDDLFFTMTAFLPAKRPLRTTTTFPGRRNLAIAEDEVGQGCPGRNGNKTALNFEK